MTRFIEATKNLKSSSQDSDCFVSPLVNKEQFTKLMGLIKRGKEEKLKLEIGGERMFEKGFFIQPTVFSGVPDSSELVDEVFGPVLCVMKPFKDCKDVLERLHKTRPSMSSGVFTSSPGVSEYLVRTIPSGTVWVNCYNMMTSRDTPSCGMRMCGSGCTCGVEAIRDFTTPKNVYTKLDLSTCCPNK